MDKRYVYAIRIFLKDGHKPMAELAFGDGGRPTGETEIIHWDDPNERALFNINSYTYIWDERPVVTDYTFNSWIHWEDYETFISSSYDKHVRDVDNVLKFHGIDPKSFEE